MSLYLVSEGLTCFGLFSGAYQSLKLLQKQEKHSKSQDVLKFWAVLGSIMLYSQYIEGFIAWFPFYYWMKCILVGGLMLPKAHLHVVAFESVISPTIYFLDIYYIEKIKPEIFHLAGLYGQWFHQAIMEITLPTLDDRQLDKLEQDLQTRLNYVQAVKNRRKRDDFE